MRPGIACKGAGTTRRADEFLPADSPVSQSRGRALKRRLCQRAVQRQFIRHEQTPRAEASWICSGRKVRSPASRGDVSRVCVSSSRGSGGGRGRRGWGGGGQPLHCLLSRYDIAQTNYKAHSGDSGRFFFIIIFNATAFLQSRVAHLCVRSILRCNSGGQRGVSGLGETIAATPA